jgi:hypothetical protein
MRLSIVVVLAACGGHPSSPPPPTPLANHPPATPTPVQPANDAVLAWPVAPFTPAQAAEVKACDTEKLGETRYPKAMTIDALSAAFALKTTCDQATLASACAARVKDGALPPACLDAFRATLRANPAFVFANGLTGGYFGKLTFVSAPPIAARALSAVAITYGWDGLGTPVKWTVAIHDLATTPAIDVTGVKAPPAWTKDIAAAVTGLGTSLTSFLPIAKPLNAVDCTDNYPDWTLTLTFDDNTKVELATHGSNLLGLGGPWQMASGSRTYLQLGPELTRAIGRLVKALALPIGEPEGEMCRGFDLQAAILSP